RRQAHRRVAGVDAQIADHLDRLRLDDGATLIAIADRGFEGAIAAVGKEAEAGGVATIGVIHNGRRVQRRAIAYRRDDRAVRAAVAASARREFIDESGDWLVAVDNSGSRVTGFPPAAAILSLDETSVGRHSRPGVAGEIAV